VELRETYRRAGRLSRRTGAPAARLAVRTVGGKGPAPPPPAGGASDTRG